MTHQQMRMRRIQQFRHSLTQRFELDRFADVSIEAGVDTAIEDVADDVGR